MSCKILLVNNGRRDIDNDLCADFLALVDKISHIRLIGLKVYVARHIYRAVVNAKGYKNDIGFFVEDVPFKARLCAISGVAADTCVDYIDTVFGFDMLLPFICGGYAVAECNYGKIVGKSGKRKDRGDHYKRNEKIKDFFHKSTSKQTLL
jgi:hypothetical protein